LNQSAEEVKKIKKVKIEKQQNPKQTE